MKAILLVASLVTATPLSIARTERREEQAPMPAADLAVGSHDHDVAEAGRSPDVCRRTPSRSACFAAIGLGLEATRLGAFKEDG
jgi:hypothetical protein